MPTGAKPKNCYAREGSPYWQYEFVLYGERYRGSTDCEDAKGATAFVKALRGQIRDRHQAAQLGIELVPANTVTKVDDGRNHITLADAFDKYEREEGVDKIQDQKQLVYHIELLLNIGADKNIADITVADIREYVMRRRKSISVRGRPVTQATINRELARLRRTFNFCAESGFAAPSIKWALVMDASAEVERIRELKQPEWDRLSKVLAEDSPDLLPIVEFGMLSAMRKAQILELTWDRVDMENSEILIKLKTKGKNKRQHTVPISEAMARILKEQPRVEGCDRVFTFAPWANGQARPKNMKRRPFTSTGWTKRWADALTKAQIEDFRFHDLRHTGATRLQRATGNLKVTQQLLGHRNIQTTARYAHAHTEDVRNAMEQAGELRRHAEVATDSNVVPLRRAQ